MVNIKKGQFIHRKTCRLCNSSDLQVVLDMGWMPLAGDYLKKEQIGKEEYFPLKIYFCNSCTAAQLLDVISAEKIFSDYRYLSSVSLSSYFKDYAQKLKKRYLGKDDFVVEIGSNDGVLLKPLQDLGVNVLGIDPAKNVTGIAKNKGVNTITDSFTNNLAQKIVLTYGQADVILANNVLAHIDDMQDVGQGIKTLLQDDGILIFEVHYLIDLFNKLQYDFFYPGEHITYYSLKSIINFYKNFDMEVFDAQHVINHGGSVRVFVRKKNGKNRRITKRFLQLLGNEQNFMQSDRAFIKTFANKVKDHEIKLSKLLKSLKSKNKKIVGYGAAGRGNTLLNYCGINSHIIEYIVDKSPERFGRYTPGSHIPIVKEEVFKNDRADYCLILAWTYSDVIIRKERNYLLNGGNFIIPFPKIKIYSNK